MRLTTLLQLGELLGRIGRCAKQPTPRIASFHKAAAARLAREDGVLLNQ